MVDRGLHESVVTSRLTAAMAQAAELDYDEQAIDPADQPHVLARHVQQLALRALENTKDPTRRLQLMERLVDVLEAHEDLVLDPPRHLTRVDLPAGPGITRLEPVRPATPLSEAALLTNAKGEPSLGSELQAEIDTSDEVDLLCAFVKWHGLRVLEQPLKRLRDRGAAFRVITTTYMGATERAALERLINDYGAQVKVHYDTQRTRLHAKAWLFRRNSLFDTAYVGSSNLSRAALLDGVEWNVRLSRVGTPTLLDKFRATFDTYWNDPSFELYDPERDRDRLDDALAEASSGGRKTHTAITLSGLEVRPFSYQQQMLDALATERTIHDRHRNLVVAATGTGKTVVAALDYKRLCDETGSRPRLLFVAHRREILDQSLRTYREVLADENFGQPYYGDRRPERWEHVFASIQSLTSYGVRDIPADAYDVVVIDEFHHAEATSYRRLLDHLQPRELLGLTATPERADGVDVASFFDDRIAAELRLWDALDAELLCPFHYFVVADGTDLRRVSWARGKYDERELSELFTGNTARAHLVVKQVRDKVLDPLSMRALGFCVTVAHAEFMAEVFNQAGIPARAVSAQTSTADRAAALQDLRERRVNALFAVDLFNEGLDLPDVDTVLFLRPTESATVFLQQLGRGLRLTSNKPVLTALDFVGYHRKEFRFDLKLRALTGHTRKGLERAIETGFPFLPSGSQIVMDEESQRRVLDNVRSQLSKQWPQVVSELRQYGDQSLPRFLDESGLALADILREGSRSWTELRRSAGLPTRDGGSRESALLNRVRAFAHVDDPVRHADYRRLLSDDAPAYDDLSKVEQRQARMLLWSFFPDGGGLASMADGFAALREEPAVRDEVLAVVDLVFDETRHLSYEPTGRLAEIPLRVDASYSREEVLAALDFPRLPNSMREGVWFNREANLDAFFVTLKKSEAEYSPTTMYRDYWISDSLFHWESQSTTSVESPTGQRYLTGSSTVLLFVRDQPKGDFGTAPYTFHGEIKYVGHEGERPIAITWRVAR